jgi:L-serine dehydratase
VKTSFFDLFKIGIGPSSSHTMGPMRAARTFALALDNGHLLQSTTRVVTDLYGSLALTGKGHSTDRAVLLGLMGEEASTIDTGSIEPKLAQVRDSGQLALLGTQPISFREAEQLLFHTSTMYPPGAHTQHPNGVRFTAFDQAGQQLAQATYFSIGGGFIVADAEADAAADAPVMSTAGAPHPFASAAELLERAGNHGMTIAELMFANECALRGAEDVRAGVLHIWQVMQSAIDHGMSTDGTLPGGLNVRRRAAPLARRLRERAANGLVADPLAPLDWVTVFAMAVNEENAAGGRVVTAPTNGAAGVVPAVARYYQDFIVTSASHDPDPQAADEGLLRYFLTASAIGVLYKENASISGAEVGCQGEVGVACSMAAGGLAAALGATNAQIEHAAEIGMEHNLGMTCDPIGGLVQIPCIERNAMGAVKAVQACRIAMNETEGHKISLDQVIRTMYLTGLDMQSRYKETSLAGLALNIIEC